MLFPAFAADAAGEGIAYILNHSAAVRVIVRFGERGIIRFHNKNGPDPVVF